MGLQANKELMNEQKLRDEIRDKLQVYASAAQSPVPLYRATTQKQCEDFLVELFLQDQARAWQPIEEVVETIKVVNKLVDGYDAQFWRDSYTLLRDAVIEHLGDFIHEDDVAEEAIMVEAIECAGQRLKKLPDPPVVGDAT